ncbi:MAG: nuclear transport factor 2 family protein [Armatimonadota bacterium]|nr:nuclear transport factor 2 family protein [Armatimonadota bacterium]
MSDSSSKSVSDKILKAFYAEDADACAEVYSEDAVLYGLGPKFESRGKAAVRAEYAEIFQKFKIKSFDWDDNHQMSGDVAYHWGTWELVATVRATGQTMKMRARTLDVRRRQPDGSWKMMVDQASVPLPSKTWNA